MRARHLIDGSSKRRSGPIVQRRNAATLRFRSLPRGDAPSLPAGGVDPLRRELKNVLAERIEALFLATLSRELER
jgi:hypothetical protein